MGNRFNNNYVIYFTNFWRSFFNKTNYMIFIYYFFFKICTFFAYQTNNYNMDDTIIDFTAASDARCEAFLNSCKHPAKQKMR